MRSSSSIHISMKASRLFSVAFCVATATSALTMEPYIFGGRNAKEGQFPYQVSIRKRDHKLHRCGGSILSNRFILTAAHCAYSQEYVADQFVVVGTIHLHDGGYPLDLDKMIQHAGWDKGHGIA